MISFLNCRWSYVLMFLCSVPYICGPGRLQFGPSDVGGEEAQFSAVGSVIRMVLGHFRGLKKCPHLKQVASRKARLTS